jgi:hypothetical protein
MKGDKVIVRSYGNKALVRLVWEVTPDTVFICSEENYRALTDGKIGLWPVGFSKEDVFQYSIKAETLLASPTAWKELVPYAQ